MTTKERLHLLIDRLSDEQAAAELARLEVQTEPAQRRWPPRHAAIGRSGRHDLAERSEEILRAEFPARSHASRPGA